MICTICKNEQGHHQVLSAPPPIFCLNGCQHPVTTVSPCGQEIMGMQCLVSFFCSPSREEQMTQGVLGCALRRPHTLT